MALMWLRRRRKPAFGQQGDAARDSGDWAAAAPLYRRHLELHPQDFAIALQLGHALKESGDVPGAEAAYRAAAALRPQDPEPPLQLGHALKLQGRWAEARAAYALSDSLVPVNWAAIELETLGERPASPRSRRAAPPAPPTPDLPGLHQAFAARQDRAAWHKLREAGGDAEAEGTPGGPDLFDVTDLLAMLRQVGRATGIQRVQLGLCQHLLATDPDRCRFVALEAPHGPLWTLAPEDLRALIHYALAEPHDASRAATLIEAALDRGRWTHLPSARLFFLMGAFWFLAGAAVTLDRLRSAGLRIGIMAYDLIPLTHPQHTDAATAAAFALALAEGRTRWDFALAISEHTAASLRARMPAGVAVHAVPLAHRFGGTDTAGPWPSALADLEGEPFVLCVGTIESRKNHLALFQAWQALLTDGVEPPPMVWVGRPGWRVDDLMAQLAATDYLGRRIRLVHGISDPELTALYRGARFSIFPSFTEGWGLPVGESLALGRPCLAAPTGATPEAAAGFATAIDPFSPRDIALRVRHWLEHPEALAAEEARIAAGFRSRSWAECGADFVARLDECLALPRTPHEAGTGLAAQLGPGFAPLQEGIAWMTGRTATLHLPPGPVRLRMAAPGLPPGQRIALGGAWHALPASGTLAAVVPPSGRLVVHLPGPDAALRCGIIAVDAPGATWPLAAGQRVSASDCPALEADDGWLAAPEGLTLLRPEAQLRLRLEAPPGAVLRLLLLTTGGGAQLGAQVFHEGGGVLPLTADADGNIQLTVRATPGLRLLALQWAHAEDLPGRLALLEAGAPLPGPVAERLALLEAPCIAPVGGDAAGLARRLSG